MVPIDFDNDRLLRVEEVAEILRLDPKTVYGLVADGYFRGLKIRDGGALRIWKSSLNKYLQERTEKFDRETGTLETTDDLLGKSMEK